MNVEAIVDIQNCRITLYVVGWVIIQTMFVLSKTWCARLDIFGRRNDIMSLYLSSKREKLSSL